MSNVIKFPMKDKNSLSKALTTAKENYIKAGISKKGADEAIIELEAILKPPSHLQNYRPAYE